MGRKAREQNFQKEAKEVLEKLFATDQVLFSCKASPQSCNRKTGLGLVSPSEGPPIQEELRWRPQQKTPRTECQKSCYLSFEYFNLLFFLLQHKKSNSNQGKDLGKEATVAYAPALILDFVPTNYN